MVKRKNTKVLIIGFCLLLILSSVVMAGGKKEAPADAPVTVTIAYNQYFEMTFGPADPPIDAIRKAVAEKYPNINVAFHTTPTTADAWHDSYVTWFMAQDSSVDLLGVGAYWTAEFGEAGWLLPLQDKVGKGILDQLNPAYLDAHTYNGQLIGLGPWWGGIGGLYYRKDLLEKYGFNPPKTYDDLVRISKRIMADNPGMTGWTWPAMNDMVLVNRWVEFLHGFGGTYFNPDGTSAMNSREAQTALRFMKSLIDEGVSPREILTWKEEDSYIRFVSGEAVFHSGRQDMMFWLDNPEQSKIPGKWGFIPNPAAANGSPTGFYEGWAFSVNKFSRNQDAALKVLEIMFDFPVQKQFNLSQGPVQANMKVYTDAEVLANNPNMALIEKVAATAMPPIPSPHYTQMADILRENIHAALAGIRTPESALEEASRRINALR